MHSSGVERWRHIVEIVALVIAAAWGVYVFLYQERIKPALEIPDVQFTQTVNHASAGQRNELVSVDLTWRNLGSVMARVDGYVVNAYGIRYAIPTGVLRDDVVPPSRAGYAHAVARTRSPQAVETLLYTAFVPFRGLNGIFWGRIEPSTNLTETHTIMIQRGVYDSITVAVGFCVRRSDDTARFTVRPRATADGAFDTASISETELGAHKDVRVTCTPGHRTEFAI